MAKAIIWCRVSTKEQELESQKEILTKKAVEEEHFHVEDLVYIGEEGASAIKLNELYQQEVNKLLETIRTVPDVTTVFVWEVSRLARNKVVYEQLIEEITQRHIQFICDVPKVKLLDPDGTINSGAELSLSLLVTLAKQEMDIKKERFSRGKQFLASQGKFNGGVIPYGYRVDKEHDNLIVPDEKTDGTGEADIVRRVFDMYESGKSYLTIAKEMSALGLQGRAVRSVNSFTVSLVSQILSNELLTGKPHKSKGASFIRTYPPIITEEQFIRCREIAKKNNKMLSKSKRIHYAHGILKCPICGSGFTTAGDKGYYRCRDSYNYNKFINGDGTGARCSYTTCISQNVMDSLLWGVACDLETHFRATQAKEALKECKRQLSDIQQKLKAIPLLKQRNEEKGERVYQAYVDGQSWNQYQKNLAKVREELTNIKKNEAQLNEQLTHVKKLVRELESAENGRPLYPRKRRYYHKEVESITDDNERNTIIHKHIRRATVEATHFIYSFQSHPEGKEAFAKRIVLDTYYAGEIEFIFIPYDGKGGTLLRRAPEWRIQRQNSNPDIPAIPEYYPVKYEYLRRVQPDRWKYGRRERERKVREEEQQRQWKAMVDSGYVGMDEMMAVSGKAYSALYSVIHSGRLSGKKVSKKWFVLKSDFEEYLKEHAPK